MPVVSNKKPKFGIGPCTNEHKKSHPARVAEASILVTLPTARVTVYMINNRIETREGGDTERIGLTSLSSLCRSKS